jgi:hypothetical protein
MPTHSYPPREPTKPALLIQCRRYIAGISILLMALVLFELRFVRASHATARVAKTLGVTYETVRSYLKSAFLKTGTHRQAELVLKVFHVLSDPHPPAVPAAMSALELRTAVHEQGTGRELSDV